MRVKLIGATKNFDNARDMLRFSQSCARTCYSEKDFDALESEPYKESLIKSVLKSGHHSVFEHAYLNFYFDGIPKALAMVLNNERVYTTSEKSARYTRMGDVSDEQKVLYDKWISLLRPKIDRVYPAMDDLKAREKKITKLCQENARYMTSVFTPTKMVYTTSLRQLNFLAGEFERFVDEAAQGNNEFRKKLAPYMDEFIRERDVKKFRVDNLDNQTDRHLSFFGGGGSIDLFGNVYSADYKMSLAGLAQAHRHRTISYNVSKELELNAPLGFFVPPIVGSNGAGDDLTDEWIRDLGKVAKDDFPQGQLVSVNERGNLEDFRSKCILRLCGQAQYEIMSNTLETGKLYRMYVPEVDSWLKPKCMQGMPCSERCAWTGKKALERIV